MAKLIVKLLLLMGMLTTLVITSPPVFAGGCHFDKATQQCVNLGCFCFLDGPSHCACSKRGGI